MSQTHKLSFSGFSEFLNVIRAEVSGGNDSFDREQKLERHPLLSDTKKKNKAKNRNGNANTCELTRLHWMCFGANSLRRSGGQENHSGPLSDQYLAASWGSGGGSKGLGALCNVAYRKMLRQTLIVLTVLPNNQVRTPSSCIDVFARCMWGHSRFIMRWYSNQSKAFQTI